jgi:hypothetical protein
LSKIANDGFTHCTNCVRPASPTVSGARSHLESELRVAFADAVEAGAADRREWRNRQILNLRVGRARCIGFPRLTSKSSRVLLPGKGVMSRKGREVS